MVANAIPTSKPTTNLLSPTPSSKLIPTAIRTETHQTEPTMIYTATPTVLGTPLPDYKTIPIPEDAITGIIIDDRYEFTSKQAPDDISNYYQQVLPQFGWEIQGPISEGNAESATNICMTLSQTGGPFQAVVCISKDLGEELTYVRISVFNTD